MPTKQLTTFPTEADLEAAIHAAVERVFPWIPSNAIRHQTKFAFTFGRATIKVDGATDSRREARADVILYHRDRPLAVLELKRSGIALAPEDDAQGLSYARVLHPSPPLVIVTNGDEIRLLATHSGTALAGTSSSEAEFIAVVEAAARAAAGDLKTAVQTLMGSTPAVWRQAVEEVTKATLAALTATWERPALPFVSNFLLPRKATAEVVLHLERGERLVLVEGPPIIGKSNVLRELAGPTRAGDEFVTLFVEAAAGSGIVQTIADALAIELSWPVTREEARSWLLRLSRLDGPALVIAVDGFDAEQVDLRREIEDLTSAGFGPGLRVVVAVDDAAADRLVVTGNGRAASPIGRRAQRVTVDRLDDQEFELAQRVLWDHRIAFMKGAHSARELRFPWVLRAMGGEIVQRPQYQDETLAAVVPPLLSLDLLEHARKRFTDPELRWLVRAIADAVLDDARDQTRPVPLTLESLGAYIVRRNTLADRLDGSEIASLITRGYLKPAIHSSGEAILVVRHPEVVASELADLVAIELAPMSRAEPVEAAQWLAGAASNLPLGDVVCGQAILDASTRHGGVSFDFIRALIAAPPEQEAITPGMRFSTHLPEIGMADVTVRDGGTMVVEVAGQRHVIEADPDEGTGSTYADFHSWLILSHLAARPFAIERNGSLERVDPHILLEVGSAPMVLRQPGPEIEFNGVLTHDIAGLGAVVCHHAGIVEAITLSILRYLSGDWREARDWVAKACGRGSLPLLGRVDIALRELARSADKPKAAWASEMLNGPVRDAFAGLPPLHQADHENPSDVSG